MYPISLWSRRSRSETIESARQRRSSEKHTATHRRPPMQYCERTGTLIFDLAQVVWPFKNQAMTRGCSDRTRIEKAVPGCEITVCHGALAAIRMSVRHAGNFFHFPSDKRPSEKRRWAISSVCWMVSGMLSGAGSPFLRERNFRAEETTEALEK